MEEKRRKIRELIAKHDLTHKWLICRLREKGYDLSKASFSHLLCGRSDSDRTERILDCAVGILEAYGKLSEDL